jgi:hypothetical protein
MKHPLFKKILQSPLFIIAVLVCIGNWQLFFCIKSLQWDMINFWYPWRYFISECYNNGIIPLWDPYTQAGYPVHGDLQGPAYNPEAIITSFLFPMSVYFLNYLFIGYLILGAYGFYKLSSFFTELVSVKDNLQLTNTQTSAMIAGVLYALGGYNAGYGHYLYITISVGLIPWMYYYFLKILLGGTFKDACKFAVFIFLQITAGNPSFLIVSGYFFLGIGCIQFLKWFRSKEISRIWHAVKSFAGAFILVLILALPVILNAHYVFLETTRSKGLPVEWAAEEQFALRNLFTFFTPLISFEREFQAGKNQPIFDYYIGITALFFAFIGFIKFRSKWIYLFCGIAILSFLLSIGMKTPVFGLFHKYLPAFNVFRMPRLIFLYDIMFLLLLTSLGINYFISAKINSKWFGVYSLSAVFCIAISVFYFKYFYREIKVYTTDYSSIRYYIWTASQYHKAVISAIISLVFLVFGFIFYKKNKIRVVVILLLVDIVFNYNLGAIARNTSETNANVTALAIKYAPKKFAPPENIPGKDIKGMTTFLNEYCLNNSIFIKQPCYSNDNNFELTNYMTLYNDNQYELNYFLSQPLAFLADSLVKRTENVRYTTKILADVRDSVITKYKNIPFHKNSSDTIICEKFEPQQLRYCVTGKENTAFILQQNYTSLWHIYVDNIEIKPDLCFYSFPLIPLKGGKHIIEFSYQEPHYKLVLGVSIALFILIIFFLLNTYSYKQISIPSFAALVLFCSFKFYSGKEHKELETIIPLQQAGLPEYEFSNKVLRVINTRDAYFPQVNKAFSKFNFMFHEDVGAFVKKLSTSTDEYLYLIDYKAYRPAELDAIIKTYFGLPVKDKENENGFVTVYKRAPQAKFILFEKDFNIKGTDSLGIEIKKGKEFGPTFDFKPEEIHAKKYDLILVEAEIESDLPDFKGLWLSVENEGKAKLSLAYNFVHHPKNKHQQLCVYYRLPEKTKPDDEIKAFIWNDDERPVILKDFKMKVISKKAFSNQVFKY